MFLVREKTKKKKQKRKNKKDETEEIPFFQISESEKKRIILLKLYLCCSIQAWIFCCPSNP